MKLKELIPSMFHRRLLLLTAGMAAVFVVMSLQLAFLTLVRGHSLQEEAEKALARRRILPTKRGDILDRYQRVLATTRIGHNIAVNYHVLSGEWAYKKARYKAFRKNQNIWSELDETGREKLVAPFEETYIEAAENLFDELCLISNIPRQSLDKQIKNTKREVNRLAAYIWNRRFADRMADHEAEIAAARQQGHTAQVIDEAKLFREVARPIGEQVMAHPLIFDINQAARVELEARIEKAKSQTSLSPLSIWREIEIKVSRVRHYPLQHMTVPIDLSTFPLALRKQKKLEVSVNGVATHIVGWQRQVQREDVQKHPFKMPPLSRNFQTINDPESHGLKGYRSGDVLGASGIENYFESALRGQRGLITEFMDSKIKHRQEPVPGQHVQLAVDIRLQARIQAFMNPEMGLLKRQPWHGNYSPEQLGEPLNGAAVVLDVASGDVLAAVTVPGFSLQQLRDDASSIMKDHVNRPYLFRPTGGVTGGVYQPGSTLKPFSMLAAITDGLYTHNQTVECKGHLFPDKKRSYRCWIYRKKYGMRMHGHLRGSEALARSCNIYFYNIGLQMGSKRLIEWYQQFGIGRKPGSGLFEAKGDLPSLDLHPRHPQLNQASAIFMAIGQGPVRWSPLQCANSYAMLARGGYALKPRFVRSHEIPQAPNAQPSHANRLGEEGGVQIHPQAIDEVMKGMYDATHEHYGSVSYLKTSNGKRERIFNIKNVEVYGKSGTATASKTTVDRNGDGKISEDEVIYKDHSWTVTMLKKPGAHRPSFVVVVLVEYGGSGGRVAGPIANQIAHALKAEGYL